MTLFDLTWHSNILNHVLNVLWRWRGHIANADHDDKVQAHANDTYTLWRNAEQPLLCDIFTPRRAGPFQEQAFEIFYVRVREYQTRQHAGDRALLVGTLGKYAHQYHREQ